MKPLFAQIPALIHGCDYNPEQWLDAPDVLDADIRLMKEAGMNTMTLGVFSWVTLEPEEGKFNFAWLREIMDRLYEAGIYTILATPTAARPAWLDEKYPEAMRVNAQGIRAHHGVRHNFCPSSPKFRMRAESIIRALGAEFKDHPGVILWHINNEIGGECWCEFCRARFTAFLKDKYQTIDHLNKQWWTAFWSHTYNNFEQIEPPWRNGETTIHGLNLDWKRFITWNFTDYVRFESDILRDIAPHLPQTNNYMHLYPGLDYHKFSEIIDIISWDSYPVWENDKETYFQTAMDPSFDHAVMRGLKPTKPFMLMESVPSYVNWHPYNRAKKPGTHLLSAVQAIASGADSVQYFQWRASRGSFEQYHGAVLTHSGKTNTRAFQDVKALSDTMNDLKEIVGSVVASSAAVLFDWDNRWAIKDAKVLSDNTKNYEDTCRKWYTAAMTQGISADVISPLANFEDYKLVIIPMMYMIKPGFAQRVKNYVTSGGVAVMTYFSGWVNENTLCHLGGFPAEGLSEVFGLEAVEIDTLYPGQTNHAQFAQNHFKVMDYAEILDVGAAQVLASYTDDFYQQSPAVTRHDFGKGTAIYVGCRMEDAGNEYLLRLAASHANVRCMKIPSGVEYHERHGDAQYAFYINWNETAVTVHDCKPGVDLITKKSVDTSFEISGKSVAVIKAT